MISGTSAFQISRDEGALLGEWLRHPPQPIAISAIRSRPNLVMVYDESQGMKNPCDKQGPFPAAREIPIF